MAQIESTAPDAMLDLREQADAALDRLTDRQTDVLEHAAAGSKNEAIAAELGISNSSVEKHLKRAREVLGADDRETLIKRFIVLRTVTGTRNAGFRQLDVSPELVERIVAALPVQVGRQLQKSPEFEMFFDDLRGSGPRAWDAKYGRVWRAIAILAVAAILIVLAGSAVGLANGLDQMVSP